MALLLRNHWHGQTEIAKKRLKIKEKEVLDDFKNHYEYIQNTDKALHFLRNRLNPLDNFILMSMDVLEKNIDQEGLDLYSKELKRVKINYRILQERVTKILDKDRKPFTAVKTTTTSPQMLFALIRENINYYGLPFNNTLNWNLDTIDEYSISLNREGLMILLSDWLANINKHSAGSEQVTFNESDSIYSVTFQNRTLDIKKSKELVDDFNSTNRDRILQRRSHGIIMMKSVIEEMGITAEMAIEEELITLTLNFTKHEKSSNI